MSKDLSAKYYQDNKKTNKRLQKNLRNNIEIFPKKKETKSASMVVDDIEIFQKMKSKRQLSIEEDLRKLEKTLH